MSGMQVTKTHKIIASLVAVAILFGGYIILDKNNKEKIAEAPNQIVVATTTDGTINIESNDSGYTIKEVPINQGNSLPQPVPDLNRPVTKSSIAIVSESDLSIATPKIKELQSLLKNTPSNFPAWLDLASYQKMAGDYEGAVLSWQYAGKLAPRDYISLGNLGNLYAYYLKDNAKAELYYKQAISRNPMQSYLYAQLAEVYIDVFKNIEKARAILDQGLSKIPNDPNLLEFKASLETV